MRKGSVENEPENFLRNEGYEYLLLNISQLLFGSFLPISVLFYFCCYSLIFCSFAFPPSLYLRHHSIILLRSQIYYRLFRWTCICCVWCDNFDSKFNKKNRLEKNFLSKNCDFIVTIGFGTVKKNITKVER